MRTWISTTTLAIVTGASIAFVTTINEADAQAPITMKIGAATINDPQADWMRRFSEEIEKRVPGRFKVELYPGSQLGNTPRMIELAQFGAVQMIVLPPEFLAGIDPRFDLLCAPGLFDGDLKNMMNHANRVYQDQIFGRAFLELGSNKGLVGIGLFPAGPVGVATRAKASSPADIKGRKIRVLGSAMQEATMRRMGATPVSMPLGEVVPALQQGIIDGTMSTLPVLAGFHTFDAAKYFLNTHQMMDGDEALVSKLWFDKLPPELQKAVREVGASVSADMVQPTLDFYQTAQRSWIDGGGEILNMSESAHTEFLRSLTTVGPELAGRQPAYKSLYDLMVSAVERTK